MKLISLYIDSFGKLSNYSYDFSTKLNSIYEENGWGKTTLTVFIKSMLYGLNNKQERERYTPWKSLSSFGGSLIIEVSGKEYRIERNFNPKKASLDEFKLYDLQTNLELTGYDSNLGERFLNLNEASFERSVFIPQKDLDEGFGSDIEAKLANLIGGTNDSQNYDDAVDILKTAAKEIRLNSKKGLIIDKKKELSQVEDEINECEGKISGISIIQNNIKNINDEITTLTERKKELNDMVLNYSKETDKKAKLEVLKKYEDDVLAVEKEIEENNKIFNNISTSLEELMAVKAKNKELINLKTEYEIQKRNNNLEERLNELKSKINVDNVPTDNEIQLISKKIEKYQNIKSIIEVNEKEPEKKKPIFAIVLCIMSTLALIGGAGILFYGYSKGIDLEIPGIITILCSALGYIASLALFVVNGVKNTHINYGNVKSYDFELRSLEEEIREFFGKYHLYTSDYSNNLFIVRSNYSKYFDLMREIEEENKNNAELGYRIHKLETIILNFINRFNTTAQTVEEKIGELNTKLRKKKELEDELLEKKKILTDFISENNLNDVELTNISIDDLNIEIEQIDRSIQDYNASITLISNRLVEYEADILKYDELLASKEMLSNEIFELEEKYKILNLSIDYLATAQTSLLEKYVKPMKDSVNKYVSLLLKNNKEYSIDVNFKFQFITTNGLKGLDQYSRGYQTIISLCMRLALIDCLYPNEKPFIILDDPFVNFDDEKLEICKALIDDIANQYQIVYFTCHDSRVIE